MIQLAKENLEFYDHGVGYNFDYEFPFAHTHDYWEFVYTVQPLKHSINGRRVDIDSDCIFIVKPSDLHSIAAMPPPVNPHKEPTHLNLKITEEKLLELLSIFDISLSEKIHQSIFPVLHMKGDDLTFFKTNLNNILWSNDVMYKCSIIKMVIVYICLKNFETVFSLPANAAPNIPEEIKQVATKLHSPAYFDQNITDIIAETGYSKMQLSRLFKKYFSKTMYDYFLDAKLGYAQNKLILSNESVLSIANEIGFSLSHFDHVFRIKFGISPLSFRNHPKNKEINRPNKTRRKINRRP